MITGYQMYRNIKGAQEKGNRNPSGPRDVDLKKLAAFVVTKDTYKIVKLTLMCQGGS